MDITVTVEGLDSLLRQLPDEPKRRLVGARILERLSLLAEAEAKRQAPRATGNLSRSIRHHVDIADLTAVVRAEAVYAPFVEGGTGLYGPRHQRIFPQHARALRWPVGVGGAGGPQQRLTGSHRAGNQAAQFAFARSIRGMHAHPFMGPAWIRTAAAVGEVLEQAAKQLTGSEPGVA